MINGDGSDKPLLIFDGDCGFCRGWVARWRSITGDRVRYAPYQEVADQYPDIPRERFAEAVHLVQSDGRVVSGAEAVFAAMAHVGRRSIPLWMYRHVPGFAWASELGYRVVANHRGVLSRATRLVRGPDLKPSTHLLTRWLFVRLLGVVYLIAFLSLGVQIRGLIGSHGILPAAEFLEAVKRDLGTAAYWKLPTLFWLDDGDAALQGACWLGAGLSVLVIFRIAPGPILCLLWALYLSLFHVGQVFLSFQWDILLIESGLLGILVASWRLLPRLSRDVPPPELSVWLIRLLLFKLMFLSGIVKLLDEGATNPTWHQLTALTYHYETQCIPNAVAWYAHQLPVWFQKFSVVAMFVIELGVPFMIFGPRRIRTLSFVPLVFLQLLISLTGNYTFFNLLTITLCVSVLDDGFLRRFVPRRAVVAAKPHPNRARITRTRVVVTWLLGLVVIAQTALSLAVSRNLGPKFAPWMRGVYSTLAPFAISNPYGLFRQMTTRRPEIIIEGSNDRQAWRAYEFKWKPGNLKRRPSQVAPHQPRLDWQMWFAALGNVRSNAWFVRLLRRILEGSSDVLALLESNPFPDGPPRYLRATLYDYHFTNWETRDQDGTWWTRTRIGAYAPVLSLDSFRR